MEEEEALHPLRNSDQGEAVGAKRGPDGDAQQQMGWDQAVSQPSASPSTSVAAPKRTVPP